MTFTSSVRRRVWLLVWIACWLITGVGFGPLSTAAKRVREGIQQYQSGNFDEAAQRFAAADVVDPENDTILFDRACALAATGDTEEARQLWMQSSMARDVSLAAKMVEGASTPLVVLVGHLPLLHKLAGALGVETTSADNFPPAGGLLLRATDDGKWGLAHVVLPNVNWWMRGVSVHVRADADDD